MKEREEGEIEEGRKREGRRNKGSEKGRRGWEE